MSLANEATNFGQYEAPTMDWLPEGSGDSPQRRFMSREISLKADEIDGLDILDVGCGTGWFLHEALAKGAARAVGVEPSSLADVAAKTVPSAEIIKSTFQNYDEARNNFNVVSFIMSSEHMSSLDELFLRSNELLKPGGIMIVMTGDYSAFRSERFGYKLTIEETIPGDEYIVRTERPEDFGTTTDFIRSRTYWTEVATKKGFTLIEDKPVFADKQYVTEIPKYSLYLNSPFMQIFRFKLETQSEAA